MESRHVCDGTHYPRGFQKVRAGVAPCPPEPPPPVAQQDRASGTEPEGQRFKSSQVNQFKDKEPTMATTSLRVEVSLSPFTKQIMCLAVLFLRVAYHVTPPDAFERLMAVTARAIARYAARVRVAK